MDEEMAAEIALIDKVSDVKLLSHDEQRRQDLIRAIDCMLELMSLANSNVYETSTFDLKPIADVSATGALSCHTAPESVASLLQDLDLMSMVQNGTVRHVKPETMINQSKDYIEDGHAWFALVFAFDDKAVDVLYLMLSHYYNELVCSDLSKRNKKRLFRLALGHNVGFQIKIDRSLYYDDMISEEILRKQGSNNLLNREISKVVSDIEIEHWFSLEDYRVILMNHPEQIVRAKEEKLVLPLGLFTKELKYVLKKDFKSEYKECLTLAKKMEGKSVTDVYLSELEFEELNYYHQENWIPFSNEVTKDIVGVEVMMMIDQVNMRLASKELMLKMADVDLLGASTKMLNEIGFDVKYSDVYMEMLEMLEALTTE